VSASSSQSPRADGIHSETAVGDGSDDDDGTENECGAEYGTGGEDDDDDDEKSR
jgi:hypothetical protein